MEILPFDLMEVGISYDGAIYLSDRWDDVPFFALVSEENIAPLMIRLGKSAYMPSDKMMSYNGRVVNANSIADIIQETFTKIYKGKRGRKPDITFYVADGNTGEVLRKVKP